MRLSRYLFVVAAMMLIAAVVIPVLTAPAEPSARALQQVLAVRLDSLIEARARTRSPADTAEAVARVERARAELAEADEHLARVVSGRGRYWSIGGAGMVLVAFGILLGVAGGLVRRW